MSTLVVDLNKIEKNCRNIIDLLGGIEVVGVTKGCASDTRIVKAIIKGGVKIIADTNVDNLYKVKSLGAKTMYLRPAKTLKNTNLATEFDYYTVCTNEDILLLNKLFTRGNKANILLMLETGFGREGFNKNEIREALLLIKKCKNINLAGIATNTPCKKGVDSGFQLLKFSDLNNAYFEEYKNLVISGGNSNILSLAIDKKIPASINQLRIGEAILFGHETNKYKLISGSSKDAFVFKVKLAEVRFKNKMNQGLLLTGLSEFGSGSLKPLSEEVSKITNIYSDYISVKLKSSDKSKSSEVMFLPDYYALLALMSSQNVKKEYINY